MGIGEVEPAEKSISWRICPEDEDTDGNGYDSASVSVSVSSPGGLLRLAGLPVRWKTLTVSSPESLSAKWTRGVLGALCARKCFPMRVANSPATLGELLELLSEDLSGLPLERMIGVLGVRGRLEEQGGEGMNGDSATEGDSGEDVGNGTLPCGRWFCGGSSMREGGYTEGEKRPFSIERRRELVAPSSGAELGPARAASRVSTTPVSSERAFDGAGGEIRSSPSGGDSSSTLMWKSGRRSLVADGRRRGRLPRDACAPGPRSSLKDERWRRCWGRAAARTLVVAAVEEEGSAGVAYGMAAAGGEAGRCAACALGVFWEMIWMGESIYQ